MVPAEVHAVWSTNGSGTYRSVTTFWPKLSSTQLEGQIISWTDEKLVLLTQVRAIVCSSSPKHASGTWNKSNTLRCGQTNTGIVLIIFWHTHQRLLETYTIYISMKSMCHNYLKLTKSGTTIYPIYTTLGSSKMSQKTRHFETNPTCWHVFAHFLLRRPVQENKRPSTLGGKTLPPLPARLSIL